jgi:hypothetical protein
MSEHVVKLKGVFDSNSFFHSVYLNGKFLIPARSLKVRYHSPDGFSWGFGGSGPAQLALAILLEVTDEETATANYQQFKWDVIAKLPSGDFEQEIDISPYCKTPMADEVKP